MSDAFYTEVLLDEARDPQHAVLLEDFDYKKTNLNASCGDAVVTTVKLSPDGESIQAIGWKGDGCIMSQAAASVVAEKAIHAQITDVLDWDINTVLTELGLSEISPGRRKCILLGVSTLQKALKEK